ncbi:WGxxGxxG family protein [Deinococcus apachensis]|uniref:WGxxGxxG family protein n=1 Tax=Deinococcus apachensis TaxID=309886 RepID=UPI0009FCA317|nr:WGxxGxxG family protein [Deinococcus apachensis]
MTNKTKRALLVLTLALAPMPALAQDTSGTTDTTTNDDNRGFPWGLLGLIGLAGLAGRRREEPRVVSTTSTTQR